MRKSFIALAAALLGTTAAQATVVNFSYDIIDDFGSLSIASGTGSFETIGDDGVFDASGLSAFSVNGTGDLVFISANYSFGLGDLTDFSATLSGGALTDLAFTVGGAADFFIAGTDFLVNTGSVSITVAGLGAGNATALVTNFDPAPGTGDLIAIVAGPASVPEPAAWALMILGFGVAGAALRTRRQPALAAA